MWRIKRGYPEVLILEGLEVFSAFGVKDITDAQMKQLTDEELNELPGGSFAVLVKGLAWYKETSTEDGSYVIRKERAPKTLFILERLPDDTLHGYVGPAL